jgi:CHASE2 domain-containing sensor protein
MANPKAVLSPDDYSNYRNVRAVSVLFVVLGSVLALGGIGLALDEDRRSQEQMHAAVAVGIALVGLAGAIGGIAALRGSRRWAPLVYVMAALYVFGFPIGTILSIVMFKGLSRYLDSVERVRAPMVRAVEPGGR